MGNRRRRFRKRNNGMGKVKKDIKWLKKNVEFKFRDITAVNLSAKDIGLITPLITNLIPVGTDVDERIGNKITARRMFIRGYIHNDRGTPADTLVRIIIFRDKAPQTVPPVVNEILSASAGLSLVNSPYTIATAPRFKVYADHTVAMDLGQHTIVAFKFSQKLNHVVSYSSGAIDDPQLNGWYILTVGSITGDVNSAGVNFVARFSYCDS